MLDSNAIIAIVTLFVTCVPGAWFAIRHLRPRLMRWMNRHGHEDGPVPLLPLHRSTICKHNIIFDFMLDICRCVDACYRSSRTG